MSAPRLGGGAAEEKLGSVVEPGQAVIAPEIFLLPPAHWHVLVAAQGHRVLRATLVRRGERGHLVLTLAWPWWKWIAGWCRAEVPCRAAHRVFRCGPNAETWGRAPIATATFSRRRQALAAHERVVDALHAGDYERRFVASFLTTLALLLEGAAAAAARGDLAEAVAGYDQALSRCQTWDPGKVFFVAYQDIYLLRAAALERVDPRQGCEAYRRFIALYASLDRPEAETMEAAAAARRAVERLARKFR